MPFFVTNFHCVEREKFSFGKMADKAAVVGLVDTFFRRGDKEVNSFVW